MSEHEVANLRAEELAYAERATLGALLMPGAEDAFRSIVETISEPDLREVRHRTIYAVICSIRVTGAPCDPITVAAELQRRGELSKVGGAPYLHQLVQEVPTAAHAVSYAAELREAGLLRAVAEAGTRAVSRALAGGDAQEVAEASVADMQAARDRGLAAADEPPTDLLDFIAEADAEPDWVIPGVLARWDRLIVTAGEGGGKSLMLRQLAVRAAAGLHPWKKARIRPVKALLVDVENSRDQTRPWLAGMARAAAGDGAPIERGRMVVDVRPQGLDLNQPADRSWLLRRVEAEQPDLITIGPIYKIATPRSGESAEDSARALMTALEAVRAASNGAALVIEAHAPHGMPGGRRDLRPIGSSLWLRWPEFGFGLSPAREMGAEELRLMDWVPWRGSRSERSWPEQFMAGTSWPWQAIEHAGNAPIPLPYTLTAEQVAALPSEQRAGLAGLDDDVQQEVF
ncbi:AAA family ATPase [Streptomyces sp. NPDC087511]|uniref:AAA family ATPase n=1 Tax=Streptomyces sp. NPDC087511 TaxID=3365792 RepID=UPI0037FE0BD6